MKTRFDGATPGPWFARDLTVNDDSFEEDNAELAAAAPDLLRVACELAEALEQCRGCAVGDGPCCDNCESEHAVAAFHALVDPAPGKDGG